MKNSNFTNRNKKETQNHKNPESKTWKTKNRKQKHTSFLSWQKLIKTQMTELKKRRKTHISISIKPLYKLIFFCFFVCSSKSNWKYKDSLVGYERSREDIKETECSAPLAHEPFSFLLLIKMIKLRGSNWAVTHWPSC